MRRNEERRERIARWVKELVAWAEARTAGRDTPFPDPPRSVLPTADDQIRAGLDTGAPPPLSRFDELEAFARLVAAESHALVSFGAIRGYLTQQAYNSARAGPVADRARERIDRGAVSCALLRAPAWRPPYLPRPAAMRVLEGNFYDVAATPDGETAIGAEYEGALWLWNLQTGVALARIPPPDGAPTSIERVALTPDARWAAAAYMDGILRLWDLRDRTCRSTFEAHRGAIRSIQLAPNAAWALTAGADGAIRLWDPRCGARLAEIEGIEGGAQRVVASADARLAAVACNDGAIRLVGLPHGNEIATQPGDEKLVPALAMTPDGRCLVWSAQDGTLRVWDPAAGPPRVLSDEAHDSEDTPSRTDAVDVTPDGRLAISGGVDTLVRVWDLERGRCLKVLSSHTDTIMALSIAADGVRAISSTACDDPTIRLWDLAGYDPPRAHGYLGTVESLGLTADAGKAVTPGSTVRVWNLDAGTSRRLVDGLRPGDAVDITADARFVLHTEEKKMPSQASMNVLRLRDAKTGEPIRSIDVGPDVNSLAFSPEGRFLLTASSVNSGPIQLWDLATSSSRTIAEREAVGGWVTERCLSFSPDGRLALTRAGRAWRLDTAEPIRTSPVLAPGGGEVHLDVLDSVSRLAEVIGKSFYSAPVTLPGDRLTLRVDDQVLRVVDRRSGAILAAVDVLSTIFSTATVCGVVVAGDRFGALHVFHVHDATPSVPRVAAVRRYRLDLGSWDADLTSVCPVCRGTITPTEAILTTVSGWQETLPPNAIPSLHLPDEAFADPRLVAPCPLCSASLRFDPYVVDGRRSEAPVDFDRAAL